MFSLIIENVWRKFNGFCNFWPIVACSNQNSDFTLTKPKIVPVENASCRTLPDWFPSHLKAINPDFDSRIVCLPDDAQWLQTSLTGIELRVMELIPGARPRLALQLRINHEHEPIEIGDHPDLEILIQKGHLSSRIGHYHANWYYRLPQVNGDGVPDLECRRAQSMNPAAPALMYLAVGQMQQSDTRWRRIDTSDEANWFPGPVDGTDVLPLHGHGSGNVMLVRWNEMAAFKTRIDPRGEELLVVKGAVYDAHGFYPEGTWIRNPIPAWQSWGAKAGTVVYYKNGHFTDSDALS